MLEDKDTKLRGAPFSQRENRVQAYIEGASFSHRLLDQNPTQLNLKSPTSTVKCPAMLSVSVPSNQAPFIEPLFDLTMVRYIGNAA